MFRNSFSIILLALLSSVQNGCLEKGSKQSSSRPSEASDNIRVDNVDTSTSAEITFSESGTTVDLDMAKMFKGLRIITEKGVCNRCRLVLVRLPAVAMSDNGMVNVFSFQILGTYAKDIVVELNSALLAEIAGVAAPFSGFEMSAFIRGMPDSKDLMAVATLKDQVIRIAIPSGGFYTGFIGIKKSQVLVTGTSSLSIDYQPKLSFVQAELQAFSPTRWDSVSSASISPELPKGLSFDAASGVISGTVNSIVASSDYMVKAVDSKGKNATRSFKLEVLPWRPTMAPALVVKELSYGWLDASQQALKFDVMGVSPPDSIKSSVPVSYLCSGRAAFGEAKESWVACDEASGFALQKDGNHPDGLYDLRVRAVANGISGPESQLYSTYMHSALDKRVRCQDFAEISDEEMFAAALKIGDMRSTHKFGAQTELNSPGSYKVQWANGNIGEIRTLHKRMYKKTFDGVDLILLRRVWKQNYGACTTQTANANGIFQDYSANKYPVFPFIHGAKPSSECVGVVFNADGNAVCLLADQSKKQVLDPVYVNFTRKLGKAYNYYGRDFLTYPEHPRNHGLAGPYHRPEELKFCQDNNMAPARCAMMRSTSSNPSTSLPW